MRPKFPFTKKTKTCYFDTNTGTQDKQQPSQQQKACSTISIILHNSLNLHCTIAQHSSQMWTKHWSKSKAAPYWHNSDTNKTTWINPDANTAATAAPALTSAAPASAEKGRAGEGEWVERFSNSKQAPYWVNTVTNLSTWTRPATDTGGERQCVDERGGKRRRVEVAGAGAVEAVPSAGLTEEAMNSMLAEERAANMLTDPELPRSDTD
jgi:hypothetical protein